MSKEGTVTPEVVIGALDKLGVDTIGLTTMDRKYLEILSSERPTGLQYISSVLSIDMETIQEEIEPYLLRIGLIERTPRGRILVDTSSPRLGTMTVSGDLLEQMKRSLEML